jgi:isopentenyl diphosphate isomerase/L-lactate dehydrogenase-like FMN-dependent dehydrogenase
MKWPSFSRRRALTAGSLLAAAPVLHAQKLIGEPPGRIAPAAELVNAYEFEGMAQRRLGSLLSAEIASSGRKAMDRITFNPRMMVNTQKLDLTTTLFGESLFAPILIGPTSEQKRFHPEGELAMVRGAAAAKTLMIVSDRASYPIDQIASEAKTPLWYQVYAEADGGAVRSRIDRAVKVGCKVVVITVGIPDQAAGGNATPPRLADWSAIDRLRQGISVPVVLKGIMSPEDARAAVSRGMQGIVVSSYAGGSVPGTGSSILSLPAIADAVGGKVPILIDGGFTRGSDVLKGLALGAHGVLLGRSPLWGLAGYGADGVKYLIQLIQNELARDMVMCGLVNIAAITRAAVTIHRR